VKILQRLESWRDSHHNFPCYLAYTLVHGQGLSVAVRQSAGLLLKNNLRTTPLQGIHAQSVVFIVVNGLDLDDVTIRHTSATCFAAYVAVHGFDGVLGSLVERLQSSSAPSIEGSLNAVQKIWEDSPMKFEDPLAGQEQATASSVLLPLALKFFQYTSDVKVQICSITILNYALFNQVAAMDELVTQYKSGLFSLAHSSEPGVRKVVCVGLVHLSELAPTKLEAELPQLIEYMIASTQDSNEEVAIEACEFWSVFSEAGFDENVLKPFVPRIIPLLLNNMKFEEYDEEVAEAEADEEAARQGLQVEEKNSEMRPHLHSSTSHGQEDGEDEHDGDEDIVWNLRKSAAAGLDMLSSFLGDGILPILLPAVQECLQQADWKSREAAILALGAVSNGCHTGLREHVEAIVAAVNPALTDPRPMLRCISCWTLTRYSRQIYGRAMEGDSNILNLVVSGIVERVMKDKNKIVQISACGSLATLIEEDPQHIKPYMPYICKALCHGLQHYGKKSLRAVYDTISVISLADAELIGSNECMTLVLPMLFNKLDTFADGDVEMLPLLDCIGTISAEIRNSVSSETAKVLQKCVMIVERYFIAADSGAVEQDEAIRFIEHSLDTIDGLAQGMGTEFGFIFTESQFGALLVRSSTHPSPLLRQSAFGILGDLAETCMLQLVPYLSSLVEAALESIRSENITLENVDACSNALWSLGLISKVCSNQDVAQYALLALERLIPILAAPMAALPRSLTQNAASCLGRICRTTPETMAPHAHMFLAGWCAVLRGLQDGEEKQDAYEGLCLIIKANAITSSSYFKSICECFASWNRPPQEPLQTDMVKIVQGFKTQFTDNGQWDAVVSSLHTAVRHKLRL
jgi:transportin-1